MICSFLHEAQPFLFSKQIISIPFPLPHRDNTCRFFSAIHKSEFLRKDFHDDAYSKPFTHQFTNRSTDMHSDMHFQEFYSKFQQRLRSGRWERWGIGREGKGERQTRSDSIPSEHRKLAYDFWSSPGISRPTGNKKDTIRKRVAVRTYTCHANQVLEKTDWSVPRI